MVDVPDSSNLETLKRQVAQLESELAAEKLRSKKFENAFNLAQQQLKSLSEELSLATKSHQGSSHPRADSEKAHGDLKSKEDGSNTQFTAKMVHELRTPLNGILGMCDLLLKTALNHEQREQALVVHESARALLELINDFLDFAKIESGKAELEIVDFEITACLEAIADLLAEQARSKHIELVTYISPELPKVLSGDPGYIRQIVLNLASNAVKFTEHGHVLLRADLEEMVDDKVAVRFAVKDTGIGISSETVDKLFQPFTQASPLIKREFGGTGLGLTICKGLVELMNGRIGVESEPGAGSTFWFSLPLKQASGTKAAPATASSLTSMKCLIFCHEPLGEVLCEYVRSFGMVPTRAGNLQATVAALRAPEPKTGLRAAIVDASAIDDPVALVVSVEHEHDQDSTALILVASNVDEEEEEHLMAAGFAGVLSKPIKYWQLYDCLEHALSRTPSRKLDRRLTQQIPKLSLADKKVLVADDSPVNQKVASLQLRSLGLASQAVSSGEEAVEQVLAGDYSLVLMDCTMADMNGFEATAAIRAAEKDSGKRIPIIAVTGASDDETLMKCRQCGMDDILIKPVEPKKLNAMIDKWLGGKTEGRAKDMKTTQSILKPDATLVGATPLRDPIDYSQLEITCGPDVAREILRVYLSAGDTLLEGIRAAREGRDATALQSLAHQLRGSSQAVGAKEIVQLSEKMEVHARKENWVEARSVYDALSYSFTRLKRFTERKLEETPTVVS
ncbi:MAG TPA: ATP-binding protein [Candidatus Obscuribacterales bacterium]